MTQRRIDASVCLFPIAACLALVPAFTTAAETTAEDPVEFYLADRVSHEDNLFRLPSGAVDLGSFITSRDDTINGASAGAEGRMDFGRQVARLDTRIEDMRYQDNDFLDHVAGSGLVTWEWEFGSRWSGTLDARYDRALANFSDARYLGKDIVESQSYSGEAFYRVSSRWRLYGGSRHGIGDHSAEARRHDEFESDSGWAGVLFGTPAETNVRLEHRYKSTEFPELAALGSPDNREYDENVTMVRASYKRSIRTQFQASYGHVEREYARIDDGDFSGGIWRVGINWNPRTRFQLGLEGWHDLRANPDAESDYFVSDGISLTPTWTPIRALALSLALIHEDQEYIGSNPELLSSNDREDRTRAAAFIASYSPMHRLRIDSSYRIEDRSSNRSIYEYDAYVAALNIRWAL